MTLWTIAHQAPLPMGFSQQEYWSGLPFPFLGDLPDPTEPTSSASSADSLPLSHLGNPRGNVRALNKPWEPEKVMRSTGASGFFFFFFKEVTSKVALKYGLKRVQTGDSKDC